ncbi:MAG: hypothetical protein CM1200mP6_08850 [Anaerolineaceae bacterium]|nr:MAG: hypothetical protein CM1200mP6_08850 [Anaerolineaceae bacterium]
MKSFVALEMPLVLEQLAEHCQFSASRELAISLRPANSIEVSEYRLNETTEARTFLNNHPHTSIENIFDVRDEINRARLSAILQPIELVRIRNILVASRELKKTILAASNESAILFQQAQILVDLPNIEDAIGRCLNDQAEVLSTASKGWKNCVRKLKTQRMTFYKNLSI